MTSTMLPQRSFNHGAARWRSAAGVALSLCVGAAGAEQSPAPALPPVSAFTDEAQIATVSISPTGEYLAFTLRQGGESVYRIVTHPQREVKASFRLGERREVAAASWVTDHLLLAAPARRTLGSPTESPTGELATINARNGQITQIGRGFLLHTLPDAPNHVLVTGSRDRFGEVYRLNLRLPTSRQNAQRVARSPVPHDGGGGFVVDDAGRVALSIGRTEDNEVAVHHREPGSQDWRLLHTHAQGDHGWVPLLPGPSAGTFFTRDSRDASTEGIGVYDTEDGSHKLLFRHPHVDAGALLCDYDCRRVYGVMVNHHFPGVVYLDKRHPLAKVHAGLAKTYPDDFVQLLSFTRDHKLAVAYVSGDRHPGEYLLVDVDALKVEPLMAVRPDLPRDALSPMAPVEIETRDGTTIYGFVTSAPTAQKPGPMVVYVHGGPHGVRDYWGFSADVQLLASRGYHVLQVNYRGSDGYGVEYLRAGFGEWGRKIEDDVADAARWATQSGIADADRVCIYGASYGAYSALISAARTPRTYRCAVGASGIYDLTQLDNAGDIRRRRSGLAYLREVVGDDPDELAARSPVHQAARIVAPVLLIHGTEDRRAPLLHANRMRDALRSAGNDPSWLAMTGHGHGFFGNDARREVYQRILEFLDEHIGSGATP